MIAKQPHFLTFGTNNTRPIVFKNATFEVMQRLGVTYAQGVLCDSQPCTPKNTTDCQNSTSPLPSRWANAECPKPSLFDLKLNVYTPIDVPSSLGPRPAFILVHSGGYSHGTPLGFAPTWEMEAACKHFAARGFVTMTMDYRLTNGQTGGGLAPANWSSSTSPLRRDGREPWLGGFKPVPRTIWPAMRDAKAAIRFLRGNSGTAIMSGLKLAKEFVGAGGWSAGACTTAYLSAQNEEDFKLEMDASNDPTFASLVPHLEESSLIKAGVVWAGNAVNIDTMNFLLSKTSGGTRYSSSNAPLAMYRGSEDTVMTSWAQNEIQRNYNASGATCDLFAVPGVGHSTLFPTGKVATRNGVPVAPAMAVDVLNHSYMWITDKMQLQVV